MIKEAGEWNFPVNLFQTTSSYKLLLLLLLCVVFRNKLSNWYIVFIKLIKIRSVQAVQAVQTSHGLSVAFSRNKKIK